jgi:hypothetical protein
MPGKQSVVAGCDLADDPETEVDVCRVVGEWDLGGSWHAGAFDSPEDFGEWLEEYLRITVVQVRRRGRWKAATETDAPMGERIDEA